MMVKWQANSVPFSTKRNVPFTNINPKNRSELSPNAQVGYHLDQKGFVLAFVRAAVYRLIV